jgi:hypothetical protein
MGLANSLPNERLDEVDGFESRGRRFARSSSEASISLADEICSNPSPESRCLRFFFFAFFFSCLCFFGLCDFRESPGGGDGGDKGGVNGRRGGGEARLGTTA